MLDIEPLDLAGIGARRNGLSAVESTGIKWYPAGYNAQGPLASILALREQIALEDIDQVIVSVHWGGWHAIGGGAGDREEKWNPTTRESADHSMAFVVAAALADGGLSPDSFTDQRVSDPALRPLMQKIVVREDPQLTREHAGEVPRWPSRVEVVLNDGRRFARQSGPPKGHPMNPISDSELEAKYFSLSDRVQARARGQRLLDMLWSIEALEDVSELTTHFKGCGAADADSV